MYAAPKIKNKISRPINSLIFHRKSIIFFGPIKRIVIIINNTTVIVFI